MSFGRMFPGPLEAVQAPASLDADSVRAWILRLSETLRISPTALAREAGVAPSNLNRFLAGEGAANLGARTIDKIAKAATRRQINRFGSEEPADRSDWTDPNAFLIANVRVVATIGEGNPSRDHSYPLEGQFFLTVPLFAGLGRTPLGFMIGDDHASRAFPQRSVVIGVDLAGLPPRSGDRILVSRGKLDYTDIMVREYRVSPNGDAWLVSLSANSTRPPDIYLGRVLEDGTIGHAENPEYRLQQLIVASIRPESDDKRRPKPF